MTDQTGTSAATHVIACEVMAQELEAVVGDDQGVVFHFLDQGLHRTPQKMPPLIQEQIDLAARSAGRIVLGYGLCSNGLVGLVAPAQGLITPRCHDCIALFLGSLAGYNAIFKERPGTYYLTPGWLAEGKDPLGIIEDDYAPRVGRDNAVWVMREELKHYTHLCLIDSGVFDVARLRARGLENAEFLDKIYEELPGSLDYFRKLVYGPYPAEEFIEVKPGQEITQEMFLGPALSGEAG